MERKEQRVSVETIARGLGCGKTTVCYVLNQQYSAMHSPLARAIVEFTDGWLHPEKYGFIEEGVDS
jgi:hypothetical protein